MTATVFNGKKPSKTPQSGGCCHADAAGFPDAFRAAVEAELPAFAPAMVRARFHLWESGSTAQMVDVHGRLRGSHGVVLNTATAAAFERLDRPCRVFVVHDLDADNRRLLREGRISVVLHSDLRADARLAMRLILQERGALPVEPSRPVPIQVITPYNLPS